jgi:hypothetical protein
MRSVHIESAAGVSNCDVVQALLMHWRCIFADLDKFHLKGKLTLPHGIYLLVQGFGLMQAFLAVIGGCVAVFVLVVGTLLATAL